MTFAGKQMPRGQRRSLHVNELGRIRARRHAAAKARRRMQAASRRRNRR